mmetsp:Transcript_49717/g.116110  ORF Transcript_49717/g.116110 Transcript_49717/m.116110 type:complete len:882 (-) Transcript_49717:143-2788(-)
MLRVAVLTALLLTLGNAQTDPDTKVLQEANATVDKYCSVLDDLPELDEEAARDDLQGGAGEDNFIVQLVEQAGTARQEGSSPQQIADALADIADPAFIAQKAGAVILAIILFVLWILCCWFVCCPCCCKCCCRCCQRKWATGKIFKGILWLLFIAFGLGAVIMVSTSLSGANNIQNGIKGTACSAAILVKDAVAGSPSDNFIGLLPAYNKLDEISGILTPGSNFMNSLDSIIAQTEDLSKAVTLVGETIRLLEDIMNDPSNVEPMKNGATLEHKCVVCADVGPALAEVREVFEGSTGEAMAALRDTISEQLQGPALDDTRNSITQAMEPIRAAKDAFVEQVGYFVQERDGFQTQTESIAGDNSQLTPAVLLFFSVFLIITISAIIALGYWSYTDKRGEEPEACCVRCCTGCVSCSACIYAMLVLLIAGIMVIVAMFGSGVCLVLIDFNAETGVNLFTAIGEDIPAEVEQALTIADRCFSLTYPEDANFSRNLADIVDIPSPSDPDQMMTIREQIFELAIAPIQEQIESAEDSYSGTNNIPSLSSAPELADLFTMIDALQMKALYLPDQALVSAGPHADMLATSATFPTNPYAAYLGVGISCDNITLSSDLEGFGGTSVPGLNAMIQDGFTFDGNDVPPTTDPNMLMYGTAWTCPDLSAYSCNSSIFIPAEFTAACVAGGAFVQDTKKPLNEEAVFKCHTFVFANGNPCHPANMVQSGTGPTSTWSGTCLVANGGTEIMRITGGRACTIDELQQNIQDIKADLQKVFEFFDERTVSLTEKIIGDLKNLVQVAVVDPITNLMDNLSCGFMRSFWKGLTDNMCYRGMNGFRLIANSYVISGLLSLCIAFLIFIPWKISRDNKDRHSAESAAGGVEARPVEAATM